ncbi:hypothetical protein [Streptomyces bauhiniae]|uniref:hypothetical protein n=1 Tax=Streptomyces bauhiniae TaxID=2340725 RepID=UPI00367FBD02
MTEERRVVGPASPTRSRSLPTSQPTASDRLKRNRSAACRFEATDRVAAINE